MERTRHQYAVDMGHSAFLGTLGSGNTSSVYLLAPPDVDVSLFEEALSLVVEALAFVSAGPYFGGHCAPAQGAVDGAMFPRQTWNTMSYNKCIPIMTEQHLVQLSVLLSERYSPFFITKWGRCV